MLSFVREQKEKENLKELSFLHHIETVYRGKALQVKYLLGALGKYSWLLSTYNNREMRQIINQELRTRNYELIHIEPFYVYPSLPKLSIPLVIGEQNIEYFIYEQYVRKFPLSCIRPFLFLDVVKTRIWEETAWKKAKELIAVSEEDKAIMEKMRMVPVSVIPNGVDCQQYSYKKRKIDEASLRCLFVGDFAWMPNKGAVKRLLTAIWPAVISAFPKARLTIVGKQFPDSLRTYVTKEVTHIEHVPDMRTVYEAHTILLAPMGISGGTKFKLLEAFASGLVVLTSKEGYKGIRVTPGKDLFEVAAPQEYVQTLRHIVAHPEEAENRTKHARELAAKQYNWDTIAGGLESVWQRAVA